MLVDHPRDALAIQTAHLIDFFRGDALNLRNRIARVLPHWSPSVPGYSYLLGMYAFGLEECNQYAFHNYWHLALYYLDQGRHADALALHDARLHREPPDAALQLVDATSLLWRLHLEGLDLGDRADRLADNWAGRLATERGYYAFNDAHAMMAFAMAGREAEAVQLMDDLDWTVAHGTGINRRMTREVGRPVCAAIRAFGHERYAFAIDELAAVRDVAARFGGSHAQRDVLTLTLIEAALRSGQHALADHYLSERLVFKPASRWGRRLQVRAGGPCE